MHFPGPASTRATDPRPHTSPRTQMFSGQFANAGVEARFRSETGSGFVRQDRHAIALIFALEVILFIVDFFQVFPRVGAKHLAHRTACALHDDVGYWILIFLRYRQ
jgi:hypothetical protein